MVVVLLVLLVLAGDAEAVTLVTPDGEVAQPYQRWADRSLMPTAPGTILISRAADVCAPGLSGCYPNGVRREVGVSPELGRRSFLHELGHDFDFKAGTDAMRGTFMWLIGVSPWWNGNAHDPERGPVAPMEQFADGYEMCAYRPYRGPGMWISDVDEYQPPPRVARQVCALIRRTAGWYMRPNAASGSAGSRAPAR